MLDMIKFPICRRFPNNCAYQLGTRTVGRIDNQISEDNSVISFDNLSYDWAAATDPSYGGRLFYLACNADYSAIPDDKNEAEKR
eukprot:scaffold4612_cov155-Skeletonema_dohrnii-CCMP3373.AAC.2